MREAEGPPFPDGEKKEGKVGWLRLGGSGHLGLALVGALAAALVGAFVFIAAGRYLALSFAGARHPGEAGSGVIGAGLAGPASPSAYHPLETANPGFSDSVSELLRARAAISPLAERLSTGSLAGQSPEEAARVAASLVATARRGGLDPARAVGAALPGPSAAAALLAIDRDLDDFREAAARTGRAAEAYAEMAELVPKMRALRRQIEAALAAAYAELSRGPDGSLPPQASDGKIGPLARRGEVYPPPRRDLDRAHPYALDIFFTRVQSGMGGEIGPEILSVSSGIVLASARDWKGGAGQSSYRSGGLSPNSGNGVIVYDPAARRYYSYFHLSKVFVEPGSVVTKGQSLGRGGDTGSNARKAGHGGHVHFEIFDAAHGKALAALEVRGLLF
ncbi:MAG: M23 family metallopeptidase [Spirochaetaceae bacterium]|nr:M23 family metallopeptidase [Spirochaetaceae bacterium]